MAAAAPRGREHRPRRRRSPSASPPPAPGRLGLRRLGRGLLLVRSPCRASRSPRRRAPPPFPAKTTPAIVPAKSTTATSTKRLSRLPGKFGRGAGEKEERSAKTISRPARTPSPIFLGGDREQHGPEPTRATRVEAPSSGRGPSAAASTARPVPCARTRRRRVCRVDPVGVAHALVEADSGRTDESANASRRRTCCGRR